MSEKYGCHNCYWEDSNYNAYPCGKCVELQKHDGVSDDENYKPPVWTEKREDDATSQPGVEKFCESCRYELLDSESLPCIECVPTSDRLASPTRYEKSVFPPPETQIRDSGERTVSEKLDFVNRDNVRRVSCLTLLDHYGLPEQMHQTIEECGELIVALRHFDRGKATQDDVIGEIADVIIMCEQLRFAFGQDKIDETIDFKLSRQMERAIKGDEEVSDDQR